MMRKETLPPFIHPVWFSECGEIKGSFPEALVNCMTIAQMFVNRGKETNKFMWRTIRMEQERMWFEVCDRVWPIKLSNLLIHLQVSQFQ